MHVLETIDPSLITQHVPYTLNGIEHQHSDSKLDQIAHFCTST